MTFTRVVCYSLIVALGGCKPPHTMPQFPWPPPMPSSVVALPPGLVAVAGHDSLGHVFDRLRVALNQVNLGWWSTYAIDTTGFTIVTRMEAIEADGTPKHGGERWRTPSQLENARFENIGEYLRALLFARPGHYRVIAFAVTDRPLQVSDAQLTAENARRLVYGGTDQLPGWLRTMPLGSDGRCVALVYEFERPSEGDSARFVPSGTVLAGDHLVRAGLFTEIELRK